MRTIVEATVTAITTAMVTWKSPVASRTRNTMVSGAPMIAAATAPIPASMKTLCSASSAGEK